MYQQRAWDVEHRVYMPKFEIKTPNLQFKIENRPGQHQIKW